MSQEDKHIDNLFKEKLDGRSFDGPPADFLADLNQRLDAKPVVSRSWIWILFLNLFIIGLFIVNATVDFSSTKTVGLAQQIESDEQSSSKEKSSESENEQMKNSLAKGAGYTAEKEKENDNETETKTQKDLTKRESNLINSDDSKLNTKDSGGNKNTLTKSYKNSNGENSSENNSSEDNSSSSTTKNPNKENSSEKNNATNVKGDKEKASNKPTKKETNLEKSTSNQADKPLIKNESLSPYVSYSTVYATQFFEVDEKIKSDDFPKFQNPWSDLVTESNNAAPQQSPEKKDKPERNMFEIQLQGGATQWSFKTLGTNANYVNQIDEAGTPKWTPSFGLGFNVNFNNISIGTGIDFAKFKTENLFEFSEISTFDSTYIGGYNENVTYDSIGNPIDTTYTPYYDSTTVTDTSYNSNLITNEYEWIQIPLHIGYRFNLNKWAIIPRVGANIGIGIRQTSGQYPNEAYDNLQTIDPVKWNLNLHTSLEVRRDFGNWHAFGKFNYQRNLTPTIDNALFERKFNGIGFNFGVGYSF